MLEDQPNCRTCRWAIPSNGITWLPDCGELMCGASNWFGCMDGRYDHWSPKADLSPEPSSNRNCAIARARRWIVFEDKG